MTSTELLPITIIGAGIAGLVAAISLQKSGHEVTIYEQSSLAHEIGAAFHITPNASILLSKLGINVYDGGAVDFVANVFRDQSDGHVLQEIPKHPRFKNLPPGEDWVLAHRYHLHKQLKDKAIAEGVNLLTGKHVSKVEGLHVEFQDGTTHDAQVLLGGDGVHSKVRESLYPDLHPFTTPYAAFRFLLDREDIEKQRHLFRNDMFQPGRTEYWGQPAGRFLILYPTSRGTQLNFVCIFPASLLDKDVKHDSQYSQKASTEQLQFVFKGFDPQIQALIQMADPEHLRYWPLMDMAEVPSYVSGNIALLGDAAHPFLPFAYQGAGLAIEDGSSLAALISGVESKDTLKTRLEMYEKLRHQRCAGEQQFSRDLFKDHSHDAHWDPAAKFEDIYLYRILEEVKKMKHSS